MEVVLLISIVIIWTKVAVALTRDDAEEALSQLEKGVSASGILGSREQATRGIADQKKMLLDNPQISKPLLLRDFHDKSKPKIQRVACFDLLSDERMKGLLQPSDLNFLSTVLKDSQEDIYMRMNAGKLILLSGDSASAEREAVKTFALDQVKNSRLSGDIKSTLLIHFQGDPEVEDVLIRDLRAASHKSEDIWVLGKIRSKKALPILVDLIQSPEANITFKKTRAYLALGDIGGEEAFSQLERFSQVEKDEQELHMILYAMGVTKSSRAKNFLIDYLLNKPKEHFFAALDGLRFLGDSSVIPLLQKLEQKDKDQYTKQEIGRTIIAIRKGDTRSYW